MRKRSTASRKRRPRDEKALAGEMLRRLREGSDTRARKIRRVGAAIRADRYENALKLNVALDRVLEELG
jgi:hypothetical protein